MVQRFILGSFVYELEARLDTQNVIQRFVLLEFEAHVCVGLNLDLLDKVLVLSFVAFKFVAGLHAAFPITWNYMFQF